MASAHTIQKQYLHVELNGTESQAFALQNQLSALCYDSLFLSLEKVFNRFSQTDTTWCIDRLDIDAGTVALDRLQVELAERVANQIEKQLQAHVSQNFGRHDAQTIKVESKSRQQTIEEAFVFFLSSGRLPWSYSLAEGETLESQLLDSWYRGGQQNFLSRSTYRDLLKSADVRKRLVSQFSAKFLTELLARISPENEKPVVAIMAEIGRADIPNSEMKQLGHLLWETVLLHISQDKVLTERDLVDIVLTPFTGSSAASPKLTATLERLWSATASGPKVGHQMGDSLSSEQKSLVDSILQTLSDSGLDSETLMLLEKEMLKVVAADSGRISLTEQALVASVWRNLPTSLKQSGLKNIMQRNWPDMMTLEEPQESFPSGVHNDLNPYRQSIDSASDDLTQGIYITNAGLVLMHPFLPQLFRTLNIAYDDTIVHPNRALALLHFLATGQRESPEYELVLPKLLCGLSLENPVESMIALTEIEIEEAEALLQAVIKHWDVLKNTGIDGLRGTFLLRSGKLSQREDGDWFLQVENKGFDILMAQLPWGIGMIKLPWMQRLLWVEWN